MKRDFHSARERFIKAFAERDLTNYKPYRTAEQKAEARRTARMVDGRWVSDAPRSYHPGAHPGSAKRRE